MADQEYLEILSLYLPYGVNILVNSGTMRPYPTVLDFEKLTRKKNKEHFKMMLRPLSDFSDINSEAMKRLECDAWAKSEIGSLANGNISMLSTSYMAIKAMAEANIDFANLIPQGLAINLNELKNEGN